MSKGLKYITVNYRKTQEVYPDQCVRCKNPHKYDNIYRTNCKHVYCKDCYYYLEGYNSCGVDPDEWSEKYGNGGFSCKECNASIRTITGYKAKKESVPHYHLTAPMIWDAEVGAYVSSVVWDATIEEFVPRVAVAASAPTPDPVKTA
jgi:hypothetical protein